METSFEGCSALMMREMLSLDPISRNYRSSMPSQRLYLGFGGGGFGRSVASYIPRPILKAATGLVIIL